MIDENFTNIFFYNKQMCNSPIIWFILIFWFLSLCDFITCDLYDLIWINLERAAFAKYARWSPILVLVSQYWNTLQNHKIVSYFHIRESSCTPPLRTYIEMK